MKTSTRLLVVSVIVAAAMSTVVVGLTHRRPRPETAAATDVARPAAPPSFVARGPRLPARDWRPGLERTYQVRLETRVRSRGQVMAEQVLTAQWRLAVVGRQGTGARVQARIAGARVTGHGQGGAVDERALEGLSLLDFAADGSLVASRVAPEMSGPTADLARALAASFQIVTGEGDGWETHERDLTGAYTARYDWEGGSRRLSRKKLGYEPPVVLVQSDGSAIIDGTGWPASLISDDAVRVPLPDGNVLDAEMRVYHRLLGTAPAAAVALPADLLAAAPSPGPVAETWDRAAADRARMEGKRGVEVLGALVAAAPAAVPGLMADLQAALRLDPALIVRVREAVAHTASPEAAQALVAALSGAGLPPAVDALAALARTPGLDPERRQDVVAGLGLAEGEAPSARQALDELARSDDPPTRSSALLALGNRARRAGDGDQMIDDLLARWHDAQTPDERALALRALGNTGSERILPAVTEGLAAAEPPVRGAAVVALRLVRATAVPELLGGVLDGDADAWVRTQVPFAARTQPREALLPAFARSLREDRAVEVRLAILQLLGRGPLDDGTRALLAWSAAHDPDDNVQRVARERLGS